MLPSLLRTQPLDAAQPPTQEDIFSAAVGTLFSDDARVAHGSPDTLVHYARSYAFPRSPSPSSPGSSGAEGEEHRALAFGVADPGAAAERAVFAHWVWNAGALLAELVGGPAGADDRQGWGARRFADGRAWWVGVDEIRRWSVEGEDVLELGAGAGIAGIVAARAGAARVVLSDYPSEGILAALRRNVERNVPAGAGARVAVEPHLWGEVATAFARQRAGAFTRVLAADTLWLEAQHRSLARSMAHFLAPGPDARVFVVAGFHTGRATLARFFGEVIAEEGLAVDDIFEMDVDGRRRAWDPVAEEEPIGERNKWLVVARLKKTS